MSSLRCGRCALSSVFATAAASGSCRECAVCRRFVYGELSWSARLRLFGCLPDARCLLSVVFRLPSGGRDCRYCVVSILCCLHCCQRLYYSVVGCIVVNAVLLFTRESQSFPLLRTALISFDAVCLASFSVRLAVVCSLVCTVDAGFAVGCALFIVSRFGAAWRRVFHTVQ